MQSHYVIHSATGQVIDRTPTYEQAARVVAYLERTWRDAYHVSTVRPVVEGVTA